MKKSSRGPACCKQVRPENSARMFPNPAPILRKPRVDGILRNGKGGNLLELGGGCLRDALYLQKLGFRVSTLEVGGMETRFPSQYQKFRLAGGKVLRTIPRSAKFNFVLATFVIETICDPWLRRHLVSTTGKHMTDGACFILSVRGPRDLVTAENAGVPCSDGYLTPGHTFSRSYSRAQLREFLLSCGFKRVEFLHKQATKEPELLYALAWEK